MTAPSGRELRVAPRVWLGILAVVIYLAVFITVWVVNGIDYLHVGDSADTLLKWYLIPLIAGAVVVIVIVSIYGWWRPSLIETRKRLPGWVWIFPSLLALVAIGNLVIGDTSRLDATMWLILTAGSLLVGFNEEMIARGQLIVALRSRFGELGVWLLSTLVFSLMHVPNIFFGEGVLGVGQVVITFLIGTVLYLLRRVSGTLIFAMILHGLWDFSTFASSTLIGAYAGILIGVGAVIVATALLRKEARDEKSVA